MPFQGGEREEEAILGARNWWTRINPSSIEIGTSFKDKQLKVFLVISDLCFLDQFLGFLIPR